MAVGKGTEDVSAHLNTELVFCNIENIHVMRASAISFADAVASQHHKYSDIKEIMGSDGLNYYNKIEDSGWLRHLRLILIAGIFTAEKLHFEASSVLVHCSDGW